MQDDYLSRIANERNMLHHSLSVPTCLVPKLISHVSMTFARQTLEDILVVLRASVLCIEDTTICVRQFGLATRIHPWYN